MTDNNVFDENGFALKDCRVKVYNYDRENHEFISSTVEHTVKGSGIPARSTLVENLEMRDGFTQVFNEEFQTWSYVEDHRYSNVYNIKTKKKEDIRYIGSLKEHHTLLAPPSDNHEFVNGDWIIDEELASKLKREQLLNESRSLLAEKKKVEGDIELAELLDDLELLEESQARLFEINAQIAEIKDELKSL